jgi:fermentation-respiration switch protein FrsA (DUF1100 family)
MTTAAAGFEVGASYVDQVVVRYGANSVTGRGAAATLGRLKLWGAGLAGLGGGMLAWWDFADWHKHLESEPTTKQGRKESRILATAYALRGAATITISLAEIGTAVAIAKPLFEHLTNSHSNKIVKLLGRSMTGLANTLDTQAARLLLARLVLGAFGIGLALTLVIYIFEDDALEKWCKRSCFRSGNGSNIYEEQEELRALHSAFGEVL